ncbi:MULTISPECIES: helix-turn-helix domain-containing protein [unclassified Mesorhizobium]
MHGSFQRKPALGVREMTGRGRYRGCGVL